MQFLEISSNYVQYDMFMSEKTKKTYSCKSKSGNLKEKIHALNKEKQ
jgi:hypothetical protein